MKHLLFTMTVLLTQTTLASELDRKKEMENYVIETSRGGNPKHIDSVPSTLRISKSFREGSPKIVDTKKAFKSAHENESKEVKEKMARFLEERFEKELPLPTPQEYADQMRKIQKEVKEKELKPASQAETMDTLKLVLEDLKSYPQAKKNDFKGCEKSIGTEIRCPEGNYVYKANTADSIQNSVTRENNKDSVPMKKIIKDLKSSGSNKY